MTHFRFAFAALAVIALGLTLSACKGTESTAPPPPADSEPAVLAGYKTAKSHGCLGCHSTTGKKLSASSLKGLYGSQVQLADGRTVTADDAYLRRTLTDSDAEIVRGYNKGVMSAAMKNQSKLSDAQINELVAYMKSVK